MLKYGQEYLDKGTAQYEEIPAAANQPIDQESRATRIFVPARRAAAVDPMRALHTE
jgi:hypothetical protein